MVWVCWFPLIWSTYLLLGWYRRLSDFLFGLFPCPVSCVADVFDDFACIVSFCFRCKFWVVVAEFF
jgi:hypothetical protein